MFPWLHSFKTTQREWAATQWERDLRFNLQYWRTEGEERMSGGRYQLLCTPKGPVSTDPAVIPVPFQSRPQSTSALGSDSAFPIGDLVLFL